MTKMRLLGLVAVVVAAGCGSKSSDSNASASAADTSSCGGAIDGAMKSMMDARKKMLDDRMASAGSAGGSGAMDETKEARLLERSQRVVDGLKSALTTVCSQDKWSADVLTCFGTVKKREDIQACLTKLPKDQADRATAEIMKTMSQGLNMRMRPNNGGAMIMGSAHGQPLTGAQPMPAPSAPPPAPAPGAPAPAPAPAPAK